MVDAPQAPVAPAASEVPISPSPTQTPTPIGSQAPDKPVGDFTGSEHRPQSRAEARKEAIQKAFDRAGEQSGEADKPASKAPAKAVKPVADAKPKPAEAKSAQHREGGRFAKAPQQPGQQPGQDQQPGQGQQPGQAQQPDQQAKPHPRLPEGAPYRDPPRRISEQAKADWAATPESVRGDMHRIQHEFGEAYRQYKADSDTMNTIRPFHQLATQHGTTLDRALNNYVTMEQTLRSDPIRGLDLIVNNLNLRTQDGRKIGLRDLAMHIASQSPEQHKMVQSQNTQGALAAQLGQVNQRLNALDQQQRQQQYAAKFQQTRSAIDAFAESHPRFDELGTLIQQELSLGFDLETAYRRAERLSPSTHAAQTRATPAQTRNSDRSISGSPDGGTRSTSRKPEKAVGRREAISHAIRRANGSI